MSHTEDMGELLHRLVEERGAREQILASVLDKAVGGDMKSIEFVRDLLGERWKSQQEKIRIELGEGVEDLCR